jgi:hypothetical protein
MQVHHKSYRQGTSIRPHRCNFIHVSLKSAHPCSDCQVAAQEAHNNVDLVEFMADITTHYISFISTSDRERMASHGTAAFSLPMVEA